MKWALSSDHRMPLMTGVDFLRKVKMLYPKTFRIVLSGYTEFESATNTILIVSADVPMCVLFSTTGNNSLSKGTVMILCPLEKNRYALLNRIWQISYRRLRLQDKLALRTYITEALVANEQNTLFKL
jgi:hypothetical protein